MVFYLLNRFARFMYGRYGTDKLNLTLLIAGLIISLVGQLLMLWPLTFVSMAIYAYALFRTFSRNIQARQKEYFTFLKLLTPMTKWFKMRKMTFTQRKTYKYFKCPSCKQVLRAPKGRGKIQVTCQKCHKEFIKKV